MTIEQLFSQLPAEIDGEEIEFCLCKTKQGFQCYANPASPPQNEDDLSFIHDSPKEAIRLMLDYLKETEE